MSFIFFTYQSNIFVFPYSKSNVFLYVTLSALSRLEELVTDVEDDGEYKESKMDNTSNLHGLLNLTSQIKSYGSIRMYWDGGYKSEGILRGLKSQMIHGTYSKNFGKHALTRHYNERFFSNILPKTMVQDIAANQSHTYTRYNSFKSYDNYLTVQHDVDRGSPISIIRFHDNKVGFACMHNKEHGVVFLELNDLKGIFYYGTWVTPVKNIENNLIFHKYSKENLTQSTLVRNYALLLPTCNRTTDEEYYFYLITSDWEERTKEQNHILFKYSQGWGCKY